MILERLDPFRLCLDQFAVFGFAFKKTVETAKRCQDRERVQRREGSETVEADQAVGAGLGGGKSPVDFRADGDGFPDLPGECAAVEAGR